MSLSQNCGDTFARHALERATILRILHKRFNSSIAHAGYLLIGLAVAFAGAQEAALGAAPAGRAADGLTASLFNLATYALGTTGAFAALAYLSRQGKPLETIDDLAGIGWAQPWAGLCLAICMFSLTGVPPMAGFWGKLSLFMGPVQLASDPATVSLRRAMAPFNSGS